MNLTSLLIALVPAFGWGIQPLILTKIGGKPANQILGTGMGALLVGIIIALTQSDSISRKTFILALLSGAFWVIGQVGQYISYKSLSVTLTMPFSTGLQLIGNSLIGIIMFGEWPGINAKIVGGIALLIVILGVVLTTFSNESTVNENTGKSLLFLAFTTIGYWIYSSFPKVVDAPAKAIFMPQMLGILIGAIVYILVTSQVSAFNQKQSWLSGIIGVIFGISALFYIFSAKDNGTVTAFIFAQLSVVISTLTGLIFLGEGKSKSKKQLVYVLTGLVLIVIGSIITAFIG